MSGLTACAQCMSPQTAAPGLYWKNMWYLPFQKIGPLGSFIQFFAGSKWNCGRSGSAARRDVKSSSRENVNALKSFESGMVARGAAHNFCRKSRREVGVRAILDGSNITEIPRCPWNDDHCGLPAVNRRPSQ